MVEILIGFGFRPCVLVLLAVRRAMKGESTYYIDKTGKDLVILAISFDRFDESAVGDGGSDLSREKISHSA